MRPPVTAADKAPMFVRFRQAEHQLQLSLVETRCDGDTVRHEHVASLGAIATPPSVAERAAFWEQLIKRLAALGERAAWAKGQLVVGAY
jgi:hypothetical protein